MFTGLVEETGELLSLERSSAGARLNVRAPLVNVEFVGRVAPVALL